jgi:hypothetical protein
LRAGEGFDRRQLLAGLAALLAACAGAGDPIEELSRRLGLPAQGRAWLAEMPEEQRRDLDAALRGARGEVAERAAAALAALFAPRSRLFAYVDYPEVPDRLVLCDGLVRDE